MIGTYAAVLAVCGASLALGQAAIGLCGWRRWSWLAPAVGLALLCAVCWATVRLPGEGVVSAVVVAALTAAAVAYLRRGLEGGREAARVGWPVALVALFAASLPFLVEGHFGILGTGFNPDMSQHLLATDRLADGQTSQLLRQGYPLGPHAVVVALDQGIGTGLVHGFGGLTIAIPVLASLTALAVFGELPLPWRVPASLVVGLAYLPASYLAQGAFKETMMALSLLAFALALREAGRGWADLPLRFVPPALIAAGAIYTYSFPSLVWLGPAFVLWAIAETVRTRAANVSPAGGAVGGPMPEEALATAGHGGSPAATGPAGESLGPSPVRALALALVVFFVLVGPELGRLVDFKQFETFDPTGPGLGNLFGQLSPLEALGIWPSGDFRLAPGDGAVPAPLYYLAAAFALVLLALGVHRGWRRRETALLSALAAAALAYAAARLGGTPYTAAKAIEIAAPLVALTILLPLLDRAPWRATGGECRVIRRMAEKLDTPALASGLFLVAASACSVLALANAPVGPTSYSPALTGLRPLLAADSTLVIASDSLIADEHGTPYVAWELRGGRVCIAAESDADALPPGVRFVVTEGGAGQPPFPGLRVRRLAPPYTLWETTAPNRRQSPCPLIAVRQARQGPAR